jgi:HSP20 family protein
MLMQKRFNEESNVAERTAFRTVSPRVNIMETEQEVILEAEMPGLTKEGIDVQISGEELVISGKPAQTSVPEEYTAMYAERGLNEYHRSFLLSSEIRKDKINAKYENGILRVTLYKEAKPTPRKIVIE